MLILSVGGMRTRPSHPCVLDCARSSSSLHVHCASRGEISLSPINRMEKSPRLRTNTKEDPWEPQFQRDIHKRIRLLFEVLRWQTSLCRFLANRLFVVLRPHFSHLAHVEFNNTTWAPFSPSPVTVPTEARTKAVYCPPLTLMPSPFVLLRCAETKKMSGSWFVLCLLVLSFLHSHRPLGENHPGGARHRDQRYTLLLPDALCGAASHL